MRAMFLLGRLRLPQHHAPLAFLVLVTEPTINFLRPTLSYEAVENPGAWKKMVPPLCMATFTQIE